LETIEGEILLLPKDLEEAFASFIMVTEDGNILSENYYNFRNEFEEKREKVRKYINDVIEDIEKGYPNVSYVIKEGEKTRKCVSCGADNPDYEKECMTCGEDMI
jgi:hypothetical protein